MMDHKLIILWVLGLAVVAGSCKGKKSVVAPEGYTILVVNPTDEFRKDELVSLELPKLQHLLKNEDWEHLTFTKPYQFADRDQDGQSDELLLLLDLQPREEKSLSLKELISSKPEPEFPKRTQAEISHKIKGQWKGREYLGGEFINVRCLKVPPEHTDHSWYIRYEGPGWESDKVAYRFYLDWRNATDIFGKKTPDMVLQNVGQDGFDSYHEPADWGQDILQVGKSLGIGSLGMWVNGEAQRIAETDSLKCDIISNGLIQSEVRTTYYGWAVDSQKVDLISELSINAGSRMTHHQVQVSENMNNLCTGLVKDPHTEVIWKGQHGVSGWGYLATYGQQSLAGDELGMAVFFRNNDLIDMTEDEFSHIVVLKPKYKQLDYYFTAAWQQEPGGITSKAAFIDYLDQQLEALNHPVEIILPAESR